ncbi:MAG TPA: hypothetical protein PKW15_07565, partial [Alphaproteobacteria bacterium]|nr:hypothetical protein [Alphaproteobacteria bacterium]
MADPRFYKNKGPLPLSEFLKASGLSLSDVENAEILDVAAPSLVPHIPFVVIDRVLPQKHAILVLKR